MSSNNNEQAKATTNTKNTVSFQSFPCIYPIGALPTFPLPNLTQMSFYHGNSTPPFCVNCVPQVHVRFSFSGFLTPPWATALGLFLQEVLNRLLQRYIPLIPLTTNMHWAYKQVKNAEKKDRISLNASTKGKPLQKYGQVIRAHCFTFHVWICFPVDTRNHSTNLQKGRVPLSFLWSLTPPCFYPKLCSQGGLPKGHTAEPTSKNLCLVSTIKKKKSIDHQTQPTPKAL